MEILHIEKTMAVFFFNFTDLPEAPGSVCVCRCDIYTSGGGNMHHM